MSFNLIKKNYFRKVAFGLGPNTDVPSDPVAWAQAQVNSVPKLTWDGPLFSGKSLLDKRAEYRFGEDEIRECYKNDRQALKQAEKKLKYTTGQQYFESLELNIRHHAARNSGAPVFERLWWFWSNHFAILDKSSLPSFNTGAFQREIIRENLCGNFTNLLKSATISFAMIKNLDNSDSVGPNSKNGQWRKKKGKPVSVNENHARELLELHSIGPAAGYSQKDVIELSYIMAGWECPWTKKRHDANQVKFNQNKHEPGEHKVFGKAYKQKGVTPKNKLIDVINDLAEHPSCSNFITHKLCRHFICDHPTEEMMKPILKAWNESGGDLPTIHKALLEVTYEYTGMFDKFQNPEVWLMQMATMADLNWPLSSVDMIYDFSTKPKKHMNRVKWDLKEIGLSPYRPTQPNGWSDFSADWISPELLLRRIVFAKKFSSNGSGHGPQNWSPVHMLQSNFDKLDRVLDYLSLDKDRWQQDPKAKELHPYNVIQTLFPSNWMVSA